MEDWIVGIVMLASGVIIGIVIVMTRWESEIQKSRQIDIIRRRKKRK